MCVIQKEAKAKRDNMQETCGNGFVLFAEAFASPTKIPLYHCFAAASFILQSAHLRQENSTSFPVGRTP